ncbi:MAG: cation diffusion facilitator family transporter [Chromatiales bacterium]|jgi:cation diffusion facilitator family transporter
MSKPTSASPISLDADATREPPRGDARYKSIRRVTVVGSLTNLLLSAAQLSGGFLTQSQALIADGLHTLSDLASDAVVLFAAKHASQEADEDHPYGHGRIETLATVVIGLALASVAVGLMVDAGQRLFEPERLLSPQPLAIAFALLAVFSKEGLYHYTMHVARRLRSSMLKANAWHHRSDVVSSLVVVVGIGGTLAGLPYLDAIAAIGVGLMIARMGLELIWHSVRELIDTALESEKVDAIRDTILAIDGVKSMHMLRTRRMGGEALADVHIQVNPRISVSEGHQIAETVRARLIKAFDEVSDVTVHIDPEDDETAPTCTHLPLRGDLIARLREQWADIEAAEHLENVALHYLQGRVHLELSLPLSALNDPDEVAETTAALTEASKRLPEVGEVVVHYR